MSNIVYSSERGSLCPNCGKKKDECVCNKKTYSYSSDGIVKVRRETKGRGGRAVITIRNVPEELDEVEKLAKELRKRLGCGGTFKDGVIEIQGEKLPEILQFFKEKGYTVKQIGG